jgi:hypothetical protein
MNDYANTYAQALKAFDMLTGKLDKDALKAQLREGLVAVAAAADSGLSVRQIETATGVSKSKVARDITAGRILASFPKASPVAIKESCDVLTATEVAKAMKSEKPLAALALAKADKLGERQGKSDTTPDVPDADESEETDAPAAAAKSTATADEKFMAALAVLASLAKSGDKIAEKNILAGFQVMKHIATNSGQVAKSA